jgi:hypothetical protein
MISYSTHGMHPRGVMRISVVNAAVRCRCPGAGKWIENDDTSRQSYAQRTSLRHDQLQQLGTIFVLPT